MDLDKAYFCSERYKIEKLYRMNGEYDVPVMFQCDGKCLPSEKRYDIVEPYLSLLGYWREHFASATQHVVRHFWQIPVAVQMRLRSRDSGAPAEGAPCAHPIGFYVVVNVR